MSKDNHAQTGQSPTIPAGGAEDPTQVFEAPAPGDPNYTIPAATQPPQTQNVPIYPASTARMAEPGAPTLSNVIAFGALGVMAIVAALGLLNFFNSWDSQWSGRAVLISVGIIVALAGAVLIYAAMKGQRAGWFLPFTIVGALIALPVGAIGAGMAAWSPSYGYVDYGTEEWVDEGSSSEGWSEEETWVGTDLNTPVRHLDPAETAIIGSGERMILNLTQIEDVHDLKYKVALDNSEMIVLLTDDQLPLVTQWSSDVTSYFEGGRLSAFYKDDYKFDWQMEQWIDTGFEASSYPFELGYPGADPEATFTFNVALNNGSVLRFEVVDEDVMGYWQTDAFPGSIEGTDTPQSGSTRHEQHVENKTDGGN